MMDLRMMTSTELEEAIAGTDAEMWRLQELVDMRWEEHHDDEARFCDTGYSDRQIDALEDKVECARVRLSGVWDEKLRRRSLSNHARLIEEAARGEIPARPPAPTAAASITTPPASTLHLE